MKERALWARHLILDHPDLVHVDEDEQVAWVFKEEDKVWYSIDGHYSGSSPEEKMAKRQERKEKQKAYEDQVRREWVDRDEYGKLRQRVLERDNHTCQNCGAKKPSKFHTHHIDKRREGGPDTMDNLITVCPPCHKVVEGIAGEDWS
jgi:rubrerythrin